MSRELTDQHLRELSMRFTDESTLVELGISLGLTYPEIKICLVVNSDDTRGAAYKMFKKWLKRQDNRRVAYNVLAEALIKAELHFNIHDILDRRYVTKLCSLPIN